VAPLFVSDEDLRSPSNAKRSSRVKERDAFFDEKSATLAVTDQKKYKGKKSADLQKAIDNVRTICCTLGASVFKRWIFDEPSQLRHKTTHGTTWSFFVFVFLQITKVSEDIKAERKTRRPILPHKRYEKSFSSSLPYFQVLLLFSGLTLHLSLKLAAVPIRQCDGNRKEEKLIVEFLILHGMALISPLIRYPSVDAEESDETSIVTLPAPTPLRSIPKATFPSRNPRFPSIPPSFLVTPPSTMRDNLRSRSYEKHLGSANAISEECFKDPGGSWDSIDSDVSIESWNYPSLRATMPANERFVSLPNLPDKVCLVAGNHSPK
jgi:hypothetical protein